MFRILKRRSGLGLTCVVSTLRVCTACATLARCSRHVTPGVVLLFVLCARIQILYAMSAYGIVRHTGRMQFGQQFTTMPTKAVFHQQPPPPPPQNAPHPHHSHTIQQPSRPWRLPNTAFHGSTIGRHSSNLYSNLCSACCTERMGCNMCGRFDGHLHSASTQTAQQPQSPPSITQTTTETANFPTRATSIALAATQPQQPQQPHQTTARGCGRPTR